MFSSQGVRPYSSRISSGLYWLGIALLVWFLAAFIFSPVLAALIEAFSSDRSESFSDALNTLARSGRVKEAIFNTVWMTIVTTITVSIVGVFQVLALDYFKVRGSWFLRLGFSVVLVFGSVTAATGYFFTYGPSGAVTVVLRTFFPGLDTSWFTGWFGVLYSHTFLLTGFHYLFLRAAIGRVDYSTIEAARALGAGEVTILRRVLLPALLPSLIAVTLLLIFEVASSFSIPSIIGGREFEMVSQIAYAMSSIRRPDLAAIIAVSLGIIVMGLIVVAQYIDNKNQRSGATRTPTPFARRQVHSKVWNFVLHICAHSLAIVYLIPPVMVIIFSFGPAEDIGVRSFPSSATLQHYYFVFSNYSAYVPFLNSALMGIVAVVICLCVSVFSVQLMRKHKNIFTKILDVCLFLPWAVPAILIAIGMVVSYNKPNALLFGLVIGNGFWLLPIAYAVVFLPLMVRLIRGAFGLISPTLEEAAKALGAGPIYTFRRVVIPQVSATLFLVSGLVFNGILTEYTLSVFLYNRSNLPLSISILSGTAMDRPEQAAISLTYITLIMVISMGVVLAAERSLKQNSRR